MLRYSAHVLLVCVAALSLLGVLALVSIGEVNAISDAKNHVVKIGIGVVIALMAANIRYQKWQSANWYLYGFSIFLLFLCFVPSIGKEVNGARRWISGAFFGMPGLRMQPSEIAKLAAIIAIAAWYQKFQIRKKQLSYGFVMPCLIVAGLVGLVAIEVDLGTSALIVAVSGILMFIAGTPILTLFCAGIASLLAFGFFIESNPERKERVRAFLNPEAHSQDAAYQPQKAKKAFGGGGVFGRGLGKSEEKRGFPEAKTDFIFPIIGEEMGLVVTLSVVLAFVLILICGFLISLHAPDLFGVLLGSGITLLIVMQGAINIGVTTSTLPNKGMPLPFISYGGTNVIILLFGIGILLSIYRQSVKEATRVAGHVSKKRLSVSF